AERGIRDCPPGAVRWRVGYIPARPLAFHDLDVVQVGRIVDSGCTTHGGPCRVDCLVHQWPRGTLLLVCLSTSVSISCKDARGCCARQVRIPLSTSSLNLAHCWANPLFAVHRPSPFAAVAC